MNLPRSLLIALLLLTALRLGLAVSHELSEDESYYYLWSQRLDWSYYSKGPGIALLLKVSTAIFGANEFGIRFFAPLLALGTSLIVYAMAREIYGPRPAAWAVILLNAAPIFNAGGVVMTIDPLSVFLWAAAMLCFWRALHRASHWNAWWLAAGLCVGLGFLAKYTNAILFLSLFLLLAGKARWRRQLSSPGPYLALGAFALCTIPVLIWNAQHGWITVTHLKERGQLDESTGIHPAEFLEYVAMHLGIYTPLLFAGLAWALWKGARRWAQSQEDSFLTAFSLPIILMYFALAWREAGEGNWTAPGMIGAGILLARHWESATLSPKPKRLLQVAALGMAFLVSAAFLHLDNVRKLGADWSYYRDPARRLTGWQQSAEAVAAEVRKANADLGGNPVFLIANRYQTAAAIAFYLPKDLAVIRPAPDYPLIHTPESPIMENQFSFWPGYDVSETVLEKQPDGDELRVEKSPFIGQFAFYISDDENRNAAPPAIIAGFESVHLWQIAEIRRAGYPVRTLRIFACRNYRAKGF